MPCSTKEPLRTVADRWFGAYRPSGLPTHRDIEPALLPEVLSSTYLVDCLDCGGYRFRFAGSQLARLFGYDPTGRKLSDVLPGNGRAIGVWADLAACTGGGWPVYRSGRAHWIESHGPVRFERVMLPLSAGGEGTVAQILGVAWFHDFVAASDT